MSLKHLVLDPFLLAKIYTQPLISEPSDYPVPSPPLLIRYLGENQKKILIFFQNEWSDPPEATSFQLLTKILQACKLRITDIALVNCSQIPGKPYRDISPQFHPKFVLLFGVSPLQLGIEQSFSNYLPQRLEGANFLVADELALLHTQTDLKKQLWTALKTFFNPAP
ncbi:MAG: hypothetical protein ACYCOO_01110 [Chitinophagaceae bacterium]